MNRTFSCFVIGDGSLTIQCANLLKSQGHDLRGIVTASKEVGAWADANGVPRLSHEPTLAAALKVQSFDYLFSIANMRVLPVEVVAAPGKFAANFHDGPLPRYAGVHATSWALMHHERTHAVTWHTIASRIDGGQILAQQQVEIAPDETAFTLNGKCFEAGFESFKQLIQKLADGTLVPRDQDLSKRSYFGLYKRPAAAAVISWNLPADDTAAMVRALEFGTAPNPLGRAKVPIGENIFACLHLDTAEAPPDARPGTVVACDASELRVATVRGALVFRQLQSLDGRDQNLADVIARSGIRVGENVSTWTEASAEEVTAVNNEACRQEHYWVQKLAATRPPQFPYLKPSVGRKTDHASRLAQPIPTKVAQFLASSSLSYSPAEILVAAFSAYVERISGESEFDLGIAFAPPALGSATARLFAVGVPVRINVDPAATFQDLCAATHARLSDARPHKTFLRDIVTRYPELKFIAERGLKAQLPIQVELLASGSPAETRAIADLEGELHLVIGADGKECCWWYDPATLSTDDVERISGQFATFLEGIATAGHVAVAEYPILSPAETHDLIMARNATVVADLPDYLVHGAFELTVQRSPDAVAVCCRNQSITYADLNSRANQLARHLRKAGVGPDTLVAVSMERSISLMVALLGTLKAGGAYVPLDPTYPAERVGFMLEDSKAAVVLTETSVASRLPVTAAKVIRVDDDWDEIARESDGNLELITKAHHIAYVIYTSGSTGKPKGVVVEHRNVVNFFVGMDQRLGTTPGVWLAVTSISFDISVLELFWTLARGFKIVLVTDEDRLTVTPAGPRRASARKIDFSLFYFASELGGDPRSRYRLLLEGAKFADENNFSAVWTPERHFHSFGGLYPNPSVASAALATLTRRVAIRAGSVVSPLHHPVRIAEEWSLVDNLSGGRVGVSFAAGWQPNDFVLAPDRYADRKRLMYEDIETIRRLWRGETLHFKGGNGRDVPVRIFPPPLQAELPVWVTAAGNPETFRQAGEAGANILTHLLGQKFEDVQAKIRIYREARAAAGHSGRGHATLMLHTFVGDSMERVKEMVRDPMCRYLGTSLDLIRDAPFAFPTFKVPSKTVADKVTQGLKDFSAEDMKVLLGFAFDRYFETSSFFGTVDRCVEIAELCKDCDADEIGCLIDFGVPVDQALDGLKALNEVRIRSNQAAVRDPSDFSLLGQIAAHGVTHLQCTPSLARMIADQPAGLEALSGLQRLMLGGEALPHDLLARLRTAVRGEVHNMYGPTETTIWSTTDHLPRNEDFITIGKPVANTQIYIVDRQMRLVPVGLPGELLIGGDGVARGYLFRDELTRERFVPDPFSKRPGSRLYRTGDLAAWRPDGRIDFLGRLDNQVKIRGHRIELGEIELAIGQHARVATAVVVPRVKSNGEADLAAFYTTKVDGAIDVPEIRGLLNQRLPDYMIPGAFVRLERLPTTPNGKIDRKTLAAMPIESVQVKEAAPAAEPKTELEQQIAAVFSEALEIASVSVDTNFASLGANSLTLVRVASRLAEMFPGRVGLVNLFQHTTVRMLAAFLATSGPDGGAKPAAQQASDRGRRRRESLLRRG